MSFVEEFYTFLIDLSKADSAVYEKLRFKAARHQLEDPIDFFARIIAYLHAYRPGIKLNGNPYEAHIPSMFEMDMAGDPVFWGEVGSPNIKRLRHALISAARVGRQASFSVYFLRGYELREFASELRGSTSNWIAPVNFFLLDETFLAALAATSVSDTGSRSLKWSATFADSYLFLSTAGAELSCEFLQVNPWLEYQRAIGNLDFAKKS